ncbi:MAG: CAP domain-containing protein [Actinomycetota bacterium]
MRKLVFGLILALGVSLYPAAGAHADTVSDEAAFVAKINDLRASKGLAPLRVNANLVAKARSWSAGMAAAGKIWHSTLSDGITEDWRKLGENVGMGGSVDGLHTAFVNSLHHYENLVDPAFGYIGVGIVMNGKTIFVTEVFMQMMPPKAGGGGGGGGPPRPPPPPPPAARPHHLDHRPAGADDDGPRPEARHHHGTEAGRPEADHDDDRQASGSVDDDHHDHDGSAGPRFPGGGPRRRPG